MAIAAGCEVYAADTNPEARAPAHEIGCTKVYEYVLDMKDDAPELIVDYAGFGKTTPDALESVAFKGTVVIVGMGILESTISTYNMIIKQLTIKGSNGGTPDDNKGVYEFFKTGKLRPQLAESSFDKIDEVLKQLKNGEVKGRLVAVME